MAFHSYTHLIEKLFNAYSFGPPSRVTGTSAWTCVDHSVSRLPPPTHIRPFQTRFRCGSGCLSSLTLPEMATRRFIMPAPTAWRRTGSGTVSLPSQGCFSPFPHGTGSLSVSREYLALRDGPRGFRQDYSCPALLRIPPGHISIRIRNCHPLWLNFPEHSTLDLSAKTWSYNPCDALPQHRFGLIPGRSPLLGESLLFSFPAGTKMFQFPALASLQTSRDDGRSRRVVPFGNRGIKGHLHLPRAYRSLSRPSSPP